MSGFKFDQFGGLFPRVSESLLPDIAATVSQNCDFGYGELRQTKAASAIRTMVNAAKSLYTDDGLTFYSWPEPVNAVRAPMAKDPYNRLYYTTESDFRVANRLGMTLSGGVPGSSYRVGVPRPTVAPSLLVPGLDATFTNKTLAARFHYEYGGLKYQEQAITLTPITEGKQWRYTPPEKKTGEAETSAGLFTITAVQGTQIVGDESDYPWYTAISDSGNPKITVTGPNTFIADKAIAVGFFSYAAGDTVPALRVKDESGLEHDLDTLYSLVKYGMLTQQGETAEPAAEATPVQAVPVIRITCTSTIDGTTVFDVYTANSSLTSINSLWKLSAAKDDSAATFTVTLENSIAEADKETRAYVYTYVNTYDEEGPPSPVTKVNTTAVLPVDVTCTRDAFAADYAPIKEIRVYHTPSGSEVADYFYAGSIPVLALPGATFAFHDDVPAAELNEPLASDHWYPPDPALVNLMQLPNGILCAIKDNELHFSEPYKPHAWPPEYVKPYQKRLIGGIAHGTGAVITTIENAFFIYGTTPGAMTEAKVGLQVAGISRYAISDVAGDIAYASNDGIVVVQGGQATLAFSEQFFTRDVWRERYLKGLSSMRFATWDGRLVVYSSTNAFTAFMIRLDEAKGSMTELPDFVASCSFVSPVSDSFYFMTGNTLNQFADGSDQTAKWKSKEIPIARPLNLGFAEAICSGSWTVRFYSSKKDANGKRSMVLRHTKSLTDDCTFSLPGGFKSDKWQIEVEGRGRFRGLKVAETANGLRDL